MQIPSNTKCQQNQCDDKPSKSYLKEKHQLAEWRKSRRVINTIETIPTISIVVSFVQVSSENTLTNEQCHFLSLYIERSKYMRRETTVGLFSDDVPSMNERMWRRVSLALCTYHHHHHDRQETEIRSQQISYFTRQKKIVPSGLFLAVKYNCSRLVYFKQTHHQSFHTHTWTFFFRSDA